MTTDRETICVIDGRVRRRDGTIFLQRKGETEEALLERACAGGTSDIEQHHEAFTIQAQSGESLEKALGLAMPDQGSRGGRLLMMWERRQVAFRWDGQVEIDGELCADTHRIGATVLEWSRFMAEQDAKRSAT